MDQELDEEKKDPVALCSSAKNAALISEAIYLIKRAGIWSP